MKTDAPPQAVARAGRSLVPVATVCLVIAAVWYVAAIPMNWVVTSAKIEAAGGGLSDILALSWSEKRPVLPAPHQIAVEMWNTIFMVKPWAVKSLVFHGWVTLSSTLVGFVFGTLLGIALAVAIVHSHFLSKSLMPWIIASQTIPIIAIAPMVVGGLGAIGITGLIPKSIISMYLCFFPVTIGMVKGLMSPDPMQLDLMRTYNASRSQILWKLRFPAAMPFFFTSLKVGVAIALTGAIVGELPTGAVAGFGARLLSGSYYGQTVQIWSALFAASLLAILLLWAVKLAEGIASRMMGARP